MASSLLRIEDIFLDQARCLGFDASEFDAVGIHAWAGIKHRIEAAFVMAPHGTPNFSDWFDSLKGPQQCLRVSKGVVEAYLPHLLPPAERVWFVTNVRDPDHSGGVFWLFHATARAVHAVLASGMAYHYFIVSKKYAWLLHREHRETLVGIGDITAPMRALQQNHPLSMS